MQVIDVEGTGQPGGVVEWDDGSVLDELIRKYDLEKLTLRLLLASWRAIVTGVILLPLTVVPIIITSGASLGELLTLAALAAGNAVVVACGARATIQHDLAAQRRRIGEQADRVREQMDQLDRLLDA